MALRQQTLLIAGNSNVTGPAFYTMGLEYFQIEFVIMGSAPITGNVVIQGSIDENGTWPALNTGADIASTITQSPAGTSYTPSTGTLGLTAVAIPMQIVLQMWKMPKYIRLNWTYGSGGGTGFSIKATSWGYQSNTTP